MKTELLEIGPLELKVLGVLNTAQELSVTDIQTSLKQTGHDLAYTTVMTVLVRLYKKNMVTRKKQGRQFLYAAATKKNSSPLKIFKRMTSSLFGSEKLKPILGLLESEEELSRADLEALKKAVELKLRQKERS